MWLLRGLKFTALGLRYNLQSPNEELSASFTKGYEGSLKKYHGMMVRPIFYVGFAFPLQRFVLQIRSLPQEYRIDRNILMAEDILT